MPLRPARVEVEHEVVVVRDVVGDDTGTVQPCIAELAPGEQPAVARRRIPDREAGEPPVVLLPLRSDAATLSVLHPADGDGVDVGRDTCADNSLAAHVVGP